ncbi:MAG: hypothetical protein ABI899_00550 [Actinomycetota bacterium]
MVIEGADLTQHVSRSHRQVKGELGGQILIGKTPNAIGAKESRSHQGEPFTGDGNDGSAQDSALGEAAIDGMMLAQRLLY